MHYLYIRIISKLFAYLNLFLQDKCIEEDNTIESWMDYEITGRGLGHEKGAPLINIKGSGATKL